MKRYVAGFAFSENRSRLLLIRKTHPEWQAGRLNGIGGHIEEKENPKAAMVREFREEAALETSEADWNFLMRLRGNGWEVYFFYARVDIFKCESVTDEKVEVVDIYNLPNDCIPNLYWLIPMACYLRDHGEESYYNESLTAERDELKDILEMQDAILNPGIGINEQDRNGYTIQVLRKDLWFVQSNRERDKALAEIEKLKKEDERLREVLSLWCPNAASQGVYRQEFDDEVKKAFGGRDE